MVLNTTAIEALRRAATSNVDVPIPLEQFDQFTLGGLLELTATAIGLPAGNRFAKYLVLRAATSDAAGHCWRVWKVGNRSVSDIHGVRTIDFYRLRTRDDCTNQPYQLFRERFVRSLRACGFPKEFAYAITGAFGEMGDNVVQHSEDSSNVYTGLIGFHVVDGYMAFSVIDVGRGVLASLSSSKAWSSISSPRAALRAAVCDRASRRLGHSQGEGFRTVLKAMVDRNVTLRFRSDDALLTIGDGSSHRHAVELCSAQLRGLQVSVSCALKRQAEEEPIILT
jgi:hypothetical protein